MTAGSTRTGFRNGQARPFLRWAGGKSKLVSTIAQYLPQDLPYQRYWEPFLGAGAMFFHLQPHLAVLSDLNKQLIDCYRAIKKEPDALSRRLEHHRRLHSIEHYYRIRERYNRSTCSPQQAANFIYLNKACFNGVFRVNTRGEFNVPWGAKNTPALPTRADLRAVSRALRRVRMGCWQYTKIVDEVRHGDLVYLDPPYPPLNGTAFFRHYTANRFSTEDQQRVADVFADLDRAGCYVLLSNAATEEIRRLYRQWKTRQIRVRRWVSSNGQRFLVNELIVTNF